MSQSMPSGTPPATARGWASQFGLALLVVEGYVYILATLAVFVGVVAFLAWGVLARRPLVALPALAMGLPAVMLAGAAIRSLAIRLPEPRGVRLTPREAPAFMSMVEEVRDRLGCPRVHRVTVNGACNAGMVQVPRLGIFGPRNTLVIGYPLLVGLSPEQLKAVVAHELGHLVFAHNRLAGWVYRTRLSWLRLATVLRERGVVPVFVRWLLATYLPRLTARSAAIAREQEFVADRCAARIAGNRTAADALVATEIGAYRLKHEFWPRFVDAVADDASPRPFARMRSEWKLPDDGASAGILETLLRDEAGSSDTHPSLRDRLRALGVSAHLPGAPERGAGDVCLGRLLDRIGERLDEEWRRTHGEAWRERQADLRQWQGRLAELEEGASSPEALFERAELLGKLGRDEDALAACRAALERDPDHAPAALAAGRMLLERGDASGTVLVEHAMRIDETLVPAACDLLVDHHEQEGREAEAQRYAALATRHATRRRMAGMRIGQMRSSQRGDAEAAPPRPVAPSAAVNGSMSFAGKERP